MVKVWGCSDDLVEIEGSKYHEDEIGCFDAAVKLWFEDGTEIVVGYPKSGLAVWWVDIVRYGTAAKSIEFCYDEDADVYSDVFRIDSEIIRHEVVYDYTHNDCGDPVHPEPAGELEYLSVCSCGNCGVALFKYDRYCRGCGRPIEWGKIE